jgi:hypothetical protein
MFQLLTVLKEGIREAPVWLDSGSGRMLCLGVSHLERAKTKQDALIMRVRWEGQDKKKLWTALLQNCIKNLSHCGPPQ